MPVVEMKYLRGACDVNRIDGESHESVYSFGMSSKEEGKNCGVSEM